MSAIEWLPRGLEQDAPPISQPLPVVRELTYRVGGDRFILDASDASFDPHFWLFVLATAKWRVGYDATQRPVYTITLVQFQVFHVLLVDYWKPAVEDWRRNQFVLPGANQIVGTEASASAPVFTNESVGGSSFTNESSPAVPTWSEG